MSSTLMWEPVQPEAGQSLSFAMKKTISRKLWDTDGSTGGAPAVLTVADIDFLQGMRAAGNADIQKDCDTLMEAIGKYGAVRLWHEH